MILRLNERQLRDIVVNRCRKNSESEINEEYEPQNSSSDISDVKIFHGISDNMMQYICHVANVDQCDEIFFKCLIYEL